MSSAAKPGRTPGIGPLQRGVRRQATMGPRLLWLDGTKLRRNGGRGELGGLEKDAAFARDEQREKCVGYFGAIAEHEQRSRGIAGGFEQEGDEKDDCQGGDTDYAPDEPHVLE